MSFRRLAVSLLAVVVSSAGSNLAAQSSRLPVESSNLSAQSSGQSTGVIVPINGVSDLGGMFTGALLVERFAAQGNGVVATGMVTGTLIANGTFRNLVLQTTLPLDLNASVTRLSTDSALAQSSCDVLHMELGGASINVLGFNIGLNPVEFDIASAVQATSSPARVSPPASPSVSSQPGTVTATLSANTTQPSARAPSTPSVGAPAPTTAAAAPTTAAAAQTQLGSLLCSVNGFRDAGNPTQVAQQLNAILMALANPQGS